MRSILSLLVFFGLVTVIATSGAVFKPGPWYEALNKPWWTPPNWLFPIAWTALYIMIAIAGWRVWSIEGIGPALVIWGVGLVLNGVWSYIMFGQQEIGWAAVDVVALWLSVVAFIVLARPIDGTAALLFVPYLVWVSYATALNFAVYFLNRPQ